MEKRQNRLRTILPRLAVIKSTKVPQVRQMYPVAPYAVRQWIHTSRARNLGYNVRTQSTRKNTPSLTTPLLLPLKVADTDMVVVPTFLPPRLFLAIVVIAVAVGSLTMVKMGGRIAIGALTHFTNMIHKS